MASKDVIPESDHDFDDLQDTLIAAVSDPANAAWTIPAAEITKLTVKQTIWVAAWAIAKDKLNSTSAQKKAKDQARKNFEKVLRPFIQKWIYRNELMDDEAVTNCGLKLRDTTPTDALAPETPIDNIKVLRENGALLPECGKVAGAKGYGCIMVAGSVLPDNIRINAQGQLVITEDTGAAPPPPGTPTLPFGAIQIAVDINPKRKKKFTDLEEGVVYYFYFYAYNAAGVSPLSAPVSAKFWNQV